MFNYVRFALLLIFGITLSYAFANVPYTKKNIIRLGILFVVLGIVQLALYMTLGEEIVRKVYPIITHLPTIFVLMINHKKKISTAIAAVTTAYICCQPAKWLGLVILFLTNSQMAEVITSITVYFLFGVFVINYISRYIATLYTKNIKSTYIFTIFYQQPMLMNSHHYYYVSSTYLSVLYTIKNTKKN